MFQTRTSCPALAKPIKARGDLSEATLHGSNLSEVNLTNADLRTAMNLTEGAQ